MPHEEATPEQVAEGLSASARRCLLSFEGGEPQPYSRLPFSPRIELFRAHLLLGGQVANREAGAALSDLGLAVRAHLSKEKNDA